MPGRRVRREELRRAPARGAAPIRGRGWPPRRLPRWTCPEDEIFTRVDKERGDAPLHQPDRELHPGSAQWRRSRVQAWENGAAFVTITTPVWASRRRTSTGSSSRAFPRRPAELSTGPTDLQRRSWRTGGAISIASIEGRGTTVTLQFPVDESPRERRARARRVSARRPAPGAFVPAREPRIARGAGIVASVLREVFIAIPLIRLRPFGWWSRSPSSGRRSPPPGSAARGALGLRPFGSEQLHYSGGGDLVPSLPRSRTSPAGCAIAWAWTSEVRGIAPSCPAGRRSLRLSVRSSPPRPTATAGVRFSDEEVGAAARTVPRTAGGFLWADDNFGMDQSFRHARCAELLPRTTSSWRCRFDRDIYHQVYDFRRVAERFISTTAVRRRAMRSSMTAAWLFSPSTPTSATASRMPSVHNDPPDVRSWP